MKCPMCQQECQSGPFPVAEGTRYFCKCISSYERFVYGTFGDGSTRYYSIRDVPCVFHYSSFDGWMVYIAEKEKPTAPRKVLAQGTNYLSPQDAHKLLLRYKSLLTFS